jgi:hypothetical protein
MGSVEELRMLAEELAVMLFRALELHSRSMQDDDAGEDAS